MAGLEFRRRSWVEFAILGVFALVFFLASGWERIVAIIQDRDLAEAVEIEVSGVPPSDSALISFWFVSSEKKPSQISTYKSPLRWRSDAWIPSVSLTISPRVLSEITNLRLKIGEHVQTFPASAISGWNSAAGSALVAPVTDEPLVTLHMPVKTWGPAGMINWPRERTFLGEVLKPLMWMPAAILLLVLLYHASRLPNTRRFLEQSFTSALYEQPADRIWTVVGFVFVAFCLAALELRQPYYFTQDDNFAQFLPIIAGAGRSLLAGHLPAWDPSQYMGAPVMTLGVYALTYPFTWVAWFLARFVFGNEYLTIEIFAIGHIVAGYFVMTRALRAVGLRPMLRATGSACFVLSGFALIFGRSWYYMLPVLVWAPALVIAAERIHAGKVGWRWMISTGLIVGLFFHAGNAQMWSYALVFFLLAIVIWTATGVISWSKALWAVPALLLGLGLAAPILLPQMAETSNIDRTGGIGASIGSATLQMILPLGSLVAHPDVWGGYRNSPRGEMFYLGLPFALAGLLGFVALLSFVMLYRQSRRNLLSLFGQNAWLICAFFAWLLAVGKPGVLWQLMAQLPVFNKFNVPGKFLAYVSLFAVIGGGVLLERTLALRNRKSFVMLSICGFGLMLLHVGLSVESFYDYGGHAYATIPQSISALREGRIMAIGPDRSEDLNYVVSLRNNFATNAGVFTTGGYDPLVANRPEDRKVNDRFDRYTAAAASAYGVRWIVIYEPGLEWKLGHDKNAWPMEVTNPADQRRFMALRPRLKLVAHDPYTSIYELPGSAPLAFIENAPDKALPISMDWSGAHVSTKGLPTGTRIVINVLARSFMSLQPGVPWTSDAWGRVSVELPHAVDSLDLTYSPPWTKALAAGLILILMSLGFGYAAAKLQSARYPAQVIDVKVTEPAIPVPAGC